MADMERDLRERSGEPGQVLSFCHRVHPFPTLLSLCPPAGVSALVARIPLRGVWAQRPSSTGRGSCAFRALAGSASGRGSPGFTTRLFERSLEAPKQIEQDGDFRLLFNGPQFFHLQPTDIPPAHHALPL